MEEKGDIGRYLTSFLLFLLIIKTAGNFGKEKIHKENLAASSGRTPEKESTKLTFKDFSPTP